MEMLGNYWTDADAALLGGNSFLASVVHDCLAMSSIEHLMQHFPDLEDDDRLQTDMTSCCDIDAYGRRHADFLSTSTMGDLPHICIDITPDRGVTSSYHSGDLCRTESGHGTGEAAAGTTLMVSPPPNNYGCHDSDMQQFEAQGRRFDAAFRLESSSQSNSNLMEYGEACHHRAERATSISPAEAAWIVDPPTPNSMSLFSSQQQGHASLSTPASAVAPSRTPQVFNSVSSLKTGPDPADAAPLMFAGDSPGTVSSGWRHAHAPPMVEMSGFVDLSDFLSPRARHTTPMQLTAEQRASLGMDSSADTPLHRRTAAFASVSHDQLQDQATLVLEPVNSRLKLAIAGQSFMASSSPASFLTPAVDQQLRRRAKLKGAAPWNFATPSCSSSPKLQPDQANCPTDPVPFAPAQHCQEPQRMPVCALAPVTPEKPRKRRAPGPSTRQQEDHTPRVEKNAAGRPADHFISNGEAVPARSSGARKLLKTAPVMEPNSAFDQLQFGMLRTHLLGTILDGNTGNIVFPAPKDLHKAGDHVARERRRRDLMNTRYQALEALLPKLPCSRDRFGIVEDTKVYVKEMEQKLSNLINTKEEGRARLEAAKVEKQGQQQGNKKIATPEAAPAPATATAKLSPLNGTNVPDLSISDDLNVEVIIDQKDEEQDIVIFVQCRSSSGAKLLSSFLQALERLQLDVSQCSTSRSSQIYFCSAVCKLQQNVLRSTLSREKMIQEMVTTLRPPLKLEEGSIRKRVEHLPTVISTCLGPEE